MVALYSDGKGGRLKAMDVRMKGYKQDPRMERPEARGEGGDWVTIGDLPDSKFSILTWYQRLVACHGRAPADLETPCCSGQEQRELEDRSVITRTRTELEATAPRTSAKTDGSEASEASGDCLLQVVAVLTHSLCLL